jgi:hypothetical protein
VPTTSPATPGVNEVPFRAGSRCGAEGRHGRLLGGCRRAQELQEPVSQVEFDDAQWDHLGVLICEGLEPDHAAALVRASSPS